MAMVLVVDDNPGVAAAVAAMARYGGLDAAVAHSGPEALGFVCRDPVDLVVLDVSMPGMSGLDVLRQVRADAALAGLPTVMFTALDDAATRREAADLGAREYVVKGRIDADSLGALVRRHLGPAAPAQPEEPRHHAAE